MRIQPQYTFTADQKRFPADAGRGGRPGAQRRKMRSSNGSIWETVGYYTIEEAKLFVGAEPVDLLP